MTKLTTIFVIGVVATLYVCTAPDCDAARRSRDYLVPLERAFGSRAAYRELWQQKLLVTPGEIARFVGLPGTEGVETTVSVYRAPGKEDSLAGDYWVTATQPSERLWNYVEPGSKSQIDPNTITIQRCDAPIPESTALAIHKTWLTMLSQSRPLRDSRKITVDSSREIFSAVDSEGNLLQAESSIAPKENTKAMVDLALSLLEYCGADSATRTSIAADIDKSVAKLLGRVMVSGASKKKPSRKAISSALTAFTSHRPERPRPPLSVAMEGSAAPASLDIASRPTENGKEKTWTMAISGTRLEEPSSPVVDIWSISATPGQLIGSCRFANFESSKYRPVKVSVEGEWRDGFFWPAVSAQVGDMYRGPWYSIPVDPKKRKLSRIEVLPGQVMPEWRVKLNDFLPYVGKRAVGRIVLSSGDFAVFELTDLNGATSR